MSVALVLTSIPLFCFASAAAIEIRRDHSSLKHLARILPLAIAALACILFLSFVFDSADFPSNRFCTAM